LEKVKAVFVSVETHFVNKNGEYDFKSQTYKLDPESFHEEYLTKLDPHTYFVSGRVVSGA
jgi:hypothetical protein